MELRRDALFGTLALLTIMTLVSFGTIGLIARMGPATRRMLEENAASTTAAQELLVLLARSGGAPLDPEARVRYARALRILERNVTVAGEAQLVSSLVQRRDGTMGDDQAARLVSVGDLEEIVELNHAAMSRADERVRQLAVTGAWAVVLLTLVAMFISYLAIQRLNRRVIMPIVHLHRVLEQASEGESHRRCHERGGTRELEEIYEVVNDLLDHRLKTTEVPVDERAAVAHAALLRLLDARSEPTFVVYGDGELLAANSPGLEVLAAEHGDRLRDALRVLARATPSASLDVAGRALHAEHLEGTPAALCTLAATS